VIPMDKKKSVRKVWLLLAILVLMPSLGLPAGKEVPGRSDPILLSLRISEARKEKRRTAYYMCLARQRKKRRAGPDKSPDIRKAMEIRRPTCDRFPPNGR